MQIQCLTADSHKEVARLVKNYLSSPSPAAIIVGGGGGTMRAAIEAAIHCDALDRTVFAPLRLGSGNVLARRLQIPKDPLVGVRKLCDAMAQHCIAQITVMRCTYEVEKPADGPCIAYAAALVGLGQFGRVPADLARHRRALRLFRAPARKILGVEAATNYEYGIALGLRALACIARPAFAERVAIEYRGAVEQLRLLGGAMLTFPISGVPGAPPAELFDEAKVILIPMKRRATLLRMGLSQDRMSELTHCYSITRNTPLLLRLLDRDHAGFFLDEDPLLFCRSMKLDVAGVAKVVKIETNSTSSGTRQ